MMNFVTRLSALALGAAILTAPANAAPLRTSYAACESAIAAELGEGRLRSDLLKAHQNDGAGRHWINVRHRSDEASSTERYRVLCETTSAGDVAELSLDSGRWKETRANRPPKAVD
ncbi:MAG: hypothetical protein AAFX44_15715 [Pseudomonadota bacterium]